MKAFILLLSFLIEGTFLSIDSVVAWTPFYSRSCIGKNKLMPSTYHERTTLHSTAPSSSDVIFESFDGTNGVDKKLIRTVSEFMMGSFWGVEQADTDKYSGLLMEQMNDLNERFGEIMGKRRLQTQLILASKQNGQGSIEGSVGVEIALLDLKNFDVLSYSQSEKVLNGAVASLGPKERRLYKNYTIVDLVAGLPALGEQYEAVAVLANLCVSPASRGNGVGEKLCKEIETAVGKDWGIGKIALKVEAENVPARKLYAKLGYKEIIKKENSVTLRPDFDSGKFQEIPCAMLTVTKTLGTS